MYISKKEKLHAKYLQMTFILNKELFTVIVCIISLQTRQIKPFLIEISFVFFLADLSFPHCNI